MLFTLTAAAQAQGGTPSQQQKTLAAAHLSLYPTLLDTAKQAAAAADQGDQGASQAQQFLLQATAQPAAAAIKDAATWEVCLCCDFCVLVLPGFRASLEAARLCSGRPCALRLPTRCDLHLPLHVYVR